MDVGQMNAEQVAEALSECHGAWRITERIFMGGVDVNEARLELLALEAELMARQVVVGKPQLAKDLEAARFSATVAHEALRRCAACTAFESAIAAAREIVGGAS